MQIGDRTHFLKKVTVPYREPQGELWELSKLEPHCYKWHHYYERYEELFSGLRGQPIKILEIGVYYGGSLRLWERYFHKDTIIVGADIDPRCKCYERDNIKVRIGDQSDEKFLQQLIDEFGQFDVIIDDGSHMSGHQRGTWQYMFRNGLKDGGLYIVEDVYNSYFPEMLDIYQQPFIGVASKAVTLMHMNYIEAGCTAPFTPGKTEGYELDMEDLEAYIKEISFSDGQVVFRRGLRIPSYAPVFNGDAFDPEEHGHE